MQFIMCNSFVYLVDNVTIFLCVSVNDVSDEIVTIAFLKCVVLKQVIAA